MHLVEQTIPNFVYSCAGGQSTGAHNPLLSYQVIVALLADNDLSDLEMIFVRVILVVVAV
jgi:hypothetical protein